MARVLCTWEVGGDLGHIMTLTPVLNALVAHGHDVYFAAKDLSRIHTVHLNASVKLLQAPFWTGNTHPIKATRTMADILLLKGYGDAETLLPYTQAWYQMMSLVRPDVVLFNYSPTAMLTAQMLGIPGIMVGNGFYTPQPGFPARDMCYWLNSPPASGSSEQIVLSSLNAVGRQFRLRELENVSDLFCAASYVFAELRLLDLYQEQRTNVVYALPETGSLGLRPVQWGGSDLPKVFAYLKHGEAHVDSVITMLAHHAVNVFCYYAGGDPGFLRQLSSEQFVISTEPVDALSALEVAEGVVCHSGIGTVMECMKRGLPVLLLPTQLEQYHNALCVMGEGAGDLVGKKDSVSTVAEKVERFVTLDVYQPHAERVQGLCQQQMHQNLTEVVCQECDALL